MIFDKYSLNYDARNAIDRGREAARKGETENPYELLTGEYQYLASWWDKGYQDEIKGKNHGNR